MMEDAADSTSSQPEEALKLLKTAFPQGKDREISTELCAELLANVPALGIAISFIKMRKTYNRLYKIQDYLKQIQKVKVTLSTRSAASDGQIECEEFQTPESLIKLVLTLSIFTLEETAEGKKAVAILWILSRLKPGQPIRTRFIEAILRSKSFEEDQGVVKTLTNCLQVYKSKSFNLIPKSVQLSSWFTVVGSLTNGMLPKDTAPYQKILNAITNNKDFYLQLHLIIDTIKNRILCLEERFEDKLVQSLATSLTLLEMFGFVQLKGNPANKDSEIICQDFIIPENVSKKMSWVVPSLPINLLGSLRRLALQKRLALEDIPHAASAWEYGFQSEDSEGHGQGLVALDGMLELVNILGDVGLRDERVRLLETAYNSLLPIMGEGEQVVEMLKGLILGAKKGGWKPKKIPRLDEAKQRKKDEQFRKICHEWDLKHMNHHNVMPMTKVELVKMMAEIAQETCAHMDGEETKLPNMIVQAFAPALATLETELGPAKFTLFKHNENMTNGFFRQKDVKKALQHYREVVRILGKQYGAGDPFTMLAKMFLGRLLEAAHQGHEGVQVLLDVHQFFVANMGESWGGSVETATSLASCLIKEERFVEAQHLYMRIIKLSKTLFGDDSENSTTALARYNISVCEYFLGKEELGLKYLVIAKTLLIMLLPPENPVRDLVVRTHKQWSTELGLMQSRAYNLERETALAKGWIEDGHLIQALQSYRLIWRKSRMVYGTNHIKALTALGQIGLIYYKMEKYHAAKERFQKLAEITAATLGEEDKATLTSRRNLAKSLHKTGAYREACELILKVSITGAKNLGPSNPQTMQDRELFGTFHKEFTEYSSKNLTELFSTKGSSPVPNNTAYEVNST